MLDWFWLIGCLIFPNFELNGSFDNDSISIVHYGGIYLIIKFNLLYLEVIRLLVKYVIYSVVQSCDVVLTCGGCGGWGCRCCWWAFLTRSNGNGLSISWTRPRLDLLSQIGVRVELYITLILDVHSLVWTWKLAWSEEESLWTEFTCSIEIRFRQTKVLFKCGIKGVDIIISWIVEHSFSFGSIDLCNSWSYLWFSQVEFIHESIKIILILLWDFLGELPTDVTRGLLHTLVTWGFVSVEIKSRSFVDSDQNILLHTLC